MIRVILIMHEPLGAALVSCARHVLGQEPDLTLFDIHPSDTPEKRLPDILAAVCAAPPAQTLMLADIYGATPYNTARKALDMARSQGYDVELLTGANLCMVLKALTGPRDDFHALVRSVRASAERGIVRAGDAP
ncbi:PTS sugar transporter subunit IIA [Pusillimonas minor]|uniref:PTS sugar transporter subunit IIA n=1 Tax=Pusillimonas minor TaxID=2697024 RepID=A0A842HMK9_9BURK|nr:PTS sugar transporter subunit IIA [Pusillimonas minor]